MSPLAHRSRNDRGPKPPGNARGDQLRPARWPKLLLALGPAVTLMACSPAALNALVLREVVADWPPGLEATLAVMAAPFGEEVTVATAAVDTSGAFVLTLSQPDAGLLVAVTSVYQAVPECHTDLSNPAAKLLFVADFAIVTGAGRPLGRLTASAREPERATSLSFVYADSEGSVLQTCSYPDASFAVALDLQIGWNPILIETSLDTDPSHYTIATAAVPEALVWSYEESSSLATEHSAAAGTPVLNWVVRQTPAEGRLDR